MAAVRVSGNESGHDSAGKEPGNKAPVPMREVPRKMAERAQKPTGTDMNDLVDAFRYAVESQVALYAAKREPLPVEVQGAVCRQAEGRAYKAWERVEKMLRMIRVYERHRVLEHVHKQLVERRV